MIAAYGLPVIFNNEVLCVSDLKLSQEPDGNHRHALKVSELTIGRIEAVKK
jgi:hypothetical protein